MFALRLCHHHLQVRQETMATAVPRQDLPPAGGYEPIRYKRYLPARGPSGYVFFLAGAAAIIYGLYKVGEGNYRNWCVAPFVPTNWNNGRAQLIPSRPCMPLYKRPQAH